MSRVSQCCLLFLAFIMTSCNSPNPSDSANNTQSGNKSGHEAGWALPSKHGQTFLVATDADKQFCINCHKPGSATGAVTCQTCHKAFPHSEDFKKVEESHSEIAKTYEGKCTLCHKGFTRLMPNFGECMYCHNDSELVIEWRDKSSTTTSTTRPIERETSGVSKKSP